MKKLAILLALIISVVGFSTTAFAQDDPYADVDPSGQTVIFWHQHSGAREEQLLEIVAEFNANNEYGITVEAINQGGYDEIFQRVTTNLAAGTTAELPGLVVAYANQSATYSLVDGVVDIDLLVNSPTWGLSEEEIADFFPGFYNADIFNGERLGFPPNRSMEVMFYNNDWLAELSAAGAISFEGVPTTPEQFQEAACAATANPFSGATSDEPSLGYQLSADASRFASWTFAHGGDIFDTDMGMYTLDSEAAVEAMTFLRGLYEAGCATDVTERFGDQAAFGQGRLLFTVGSSSGLPFYDSAVSEGAQFDWGVSYIPTTEEEPAQNIYGASVSIVRTTPELELATWLFIKYYTSPEVQARWSLASNYFPVRASVAAELEDYMAEDAPVNRAYRTAFDLLQYSVSEPAVPGYDPVRAEMAEVMIAIVNGLDDRDITEILEELNIFANEELALAMEAMN